MKVHRLFAPRVVHGCEGRVREKAGGTPDEAKGGGFGSLIQKKKKKEKEEGLREKKES